MVAVVCVCVWGVGGQSVSVCACVFGSELSHLALIDIEEGTDTM